MFMLICDEKTDSLTLFMPVDPVDFGQSVTVRFHSEAASACTNSSLKKMHFYDRLRVYTEQCIVRQPVSPFTSAI